MRSKATDKSFSLASLVRPLILSRISGDAAHDNFFLQPVNYYLNPAGVTSLFRAVTAVNQIQFGTKPVRVESSLPQQELVWLGASTRLVPPQRSPGGWAPRMTLPAG